jgi:hypothetical protein
MDTSEQEKLILELKKNKLDLEYYQSIKKSSSLSPHGTVITNEGIRALRKQNVHFMPIDNGQQSHFTSMNTNLTSGEHSLTMDSQIVVGKSQLIKLFFFNILRNCQMMSE